MSRKRKDYKELYKSFYTAFCLVATPNRYFPFNLEFNSRKVKNSNLIEVSLKKPILLLKFRS